MKCGNSGKNKKDKQTLFFEECKHIIMKVKT